MTNSNKYIMLDNVYKSYPIHHGRHYRLILDGVSFTVSPGDKLGIMGPNGAGKSTLIQLVSGALLPDKGIVDRKMSISWPLAFGGAFQGSLTGRDNAKLLARVYNTNVEETVEFVESFGEFGIYFDEPVKSYSTGMNSRLGFALSMAIDFDCFLVDEVISVGDQRFNKKCETELEQRSNKSMIMVSHHVDLIRNNCTKAAFLHQGKLHIFGQVEDAIYAYENL
jgi:capsular polysaccharide transport system ATP-binding protein